MLKVYKSDDTLQAVISDNTAANTGHRGGAVVLLEKLLGRKLHKIGCLLHWNELSLRKIIIDLDGPTAAGNKWTGPIGATFTEDIHLKAPVQFQPVSTTVLRPSDQVMADLSTDQRLLLDYVLATSSGNLTAKIVHRKPGPACTSRWLTAAIRILILYTRTEKPSSEMQRIVNFIQNVYAPGWFAVKQQNSFLAGPKILFDLLQAAKALGDPECLAIFEDKLQKWAFPLLSENFLASMLFSDQIRDRRLAALRITELKSRDTPPISSQPIQQVNFAAEHWSQLITLTSADCEPPLTARLSVEEVQAMVEHPGEPPKFPIHTQSVERAVKNTTEASKLFWSFERRHESIVAKSVARAKRPKSDSKQDL